MGYWYSRRGAAAIICAMLLPTISFAQHTIIKKDGNPISCQVLGAANGQLKITYDPGSGTTKNFPCAEVLAIIDERLIVHTDPCEAAMKLAQATGERQCASLILKDNSVVKGNNLSYMDDYVRIHTLTGDRNVPIDFVGQITEGEGVVFQNEEFAKKLLSDPVIVRAINDTAQCPSVSTHAKAGYSLPIFKSIFFNTISAFR